MDKRTENPPVAAVHAVWRIIDDFLSLKAPTTRVTYLGVVGEWARFLGAEPNSPAGAAAVVGATDLHAAAFRLWLEKQVGETARDVRRHSSTRSAQAASATRALRAVPRRAARVTKRSGLEATLSNATVAKKFTILRRIYKLLIAHRFPIALNPFDVDRVPPPAKDAGRKRPTEMASFGEVREILSLPDCSAAKGLQDKAILSVFFGGGLRRSEVIGLRLSDVRRSPKGRVFLYLRSTKAQRDASQALPPWAGDAVVAHLKARLGAGAGPGDPLFVSFRGRGGKTPGRTPLSPTGLYRLFCGYCARGTGRKFLTPHSARATSITKLLSDGVPHRLVQEFSRHASVQMVEHYDKRRLTVDENPGVDLSFEED
jgi:integrase/recombinase XerC